MTKKHQLIIFGFAFLLLGVSLYANLLISDEWRKINHSESILDFDVAAQRTMQHSLSLQFAEHDIQAKQGQVKQAALYPNPAFNYALETSEKGWHARQEIYALSQPVELGGKLQKSVKAASYEYYAALTGYETAKLERLSQLTKTFIQVVAAQELFKIAMDQMGNAEEFLKTAQNKLEAGKISLIEQKKAALTKSLAELNIKRGWTAFQTSKKKLTLLWSQSEADFDRVFYPFFDITPPEPLDDYLAKLCDQPEVRQSIYSYTAAFHTLRLEKAARIPDMTVTVGYSYDQGDKGVAAGFSLPIPLWNQNQGNIKRARYEMLKTGDEGKQLRLLLETKLSTSYLELVRAYEEVQGLKTTLIQSAREALELALEGYREGKLAYLEVLEAKRSLFEIEERYIQALVNYHLKRADIVYLNSQSD